MVHIRATRNDTLVALRALLVAPTRTTEERDAVNHFIVALDRAIHDYDTKESE